MKRLILSMVAGLALTTTSLHACAYGGIRVRPLNNFVSADQIVAAQFLGWEGRTQFIATYPKARQKQEMLIAVLKVDDAIKQDVALTHLRVAVAPAQLPTLQWNRRVTFFLNRHFSEPLYTLMPILGRASIANRARPEKGWTKTELDELLSYQRLGSLYQNLTRSLSKGTWEDRMLATALALTDAQASVRLLAQGGKKSTMSPEITRQILLNLAECKWDVKIPAVTQMFGGNVESLFWRLRPNKENGWTSNNFKTKEEYWAAARAWCRANAGTFQIEVVTRG